MQEEKEYQDFINKLYGKISELRSDYNKLSESNRQRFDIEANKILQDFHNTMSLNGILTTLGEKR